MPPTSTIFSDDQIEAIPIPPACIQFFNLEQSFAQGAEVELQGKLSPRLLLTTAYTYTSTEILDNPDVASNPCSLQCPGDPLIRRPKHSATTLLTLSRQSLGWKPGGSFVGRRADSMTSTASESITPPDTSASISADGMPSTSRVTAYANIENALDRRYNEVLGYPALPNQLPRRLPLPPRRRISQRRIEARPDSVGTAQPRRAAPAERSEAVLHTAASI